MDGALNYNIVMKKKETVRAVLTVLIVLTLIFIFRNSTDSKEESSALSLYVKELVGPILEVFVGKGNVTEHLVRKLAHFTEFFALGTEFSFLIINEKQVAPAGISLILLAGLVSALSDETIQLFFDRGSSVMDVWLDFAGYCSAVALILLIFFADLRLINRRGYRS
jgi:VanZ family protein